MRDLVTKKRIKLDYEYFIKVLGLYKEYVDYCGFNGAFIAKRRLMFNFLRRKKVLFNELYYFCKWFDVKDYSDLVIKSKNRVSDFYGL